LRERLGRSRPGPTAATAARQGDGRCDPDLLRAKDDFARLAASVRPFGGSKELSLPGRDPRRRCDYRMDHQAADAGKNYDKTFEAGYSAAL
jgi:hypothetical protein